MSKLIAKFFSDNANKLNSVKFVSFHYRSKGTGEFARHTVLLNASLINAYKADLKRLKGLLPSLTEEIDIIACNEIIKSIENSLEKGIGNNDNYTLKGKYYRPKGTPIAFHTENDSVQIRGRHIQKKVFEEGVYKVVKSSAKTLAKKRLDKDSKRAKIRSYSLTGIQSARIDGETLILE